MADDRTVRNPMNVAPNRPVRMVMQECIGAFPDMTPPEPEPEPEAEE